MAPVWFLKRRKKGLCGWYFLTPEGRLSRLRVHARRFHRIGQCVVVRAEMSELNPDYEFKVVA